jgi:uncharacterized protein YndB with AHSA1/START domain
MIAVLEKLENGLVQAHFKRYLRHSVEEVWAYLTDNDKLSKWFSELSVDELCKGGVIKFDMQNGTFEEMTILEVETNRTLEYTWGEDIVRFELSQIPDGCLLVLNEKITSITNHTPRDLAGWHVCLDVIQALLDGKVIESRQQIWGRWYEEYVKAIAVFS